MVRAFLIWVLFALPASAQVVLGDHHRFQTRHGELQVLGGEVDQTLALIGSHSNLVEGQRIWIRGAWARGDEAADWVLLGVERFDAPCVESFMFLRVAADGVSRSPLFPSCHGAVSTIELTGGAVALRFADGTAHRFDGTTLAAGGAATPTAQPQIDLIEHRPYDADRLESWATRFGTFQVENRGWADTILRFNGQELPGLQTAAIGITGAWSVGAVDWVIADTNHSGNLCPYSIYLIRVSAQGMDMSPPIGECLGAPVAARVSADRLEIDLAVPDLQIAHRTFTYDGQSVRENDTAQAIGQGNPAASDPLQWVGQHPVRPFQDPNEQARFLAIVTPDQLETLRFRIGPANPAELRGNWVLGRGCQPHACNVAAGAWGIRLSDGAAAAAILESGRPPQLFGASNDPAFASFVAEAQAGLQ